VVFIAGPPSNLPLQVPRPKDLAWTHFAGHVTPKSNSVPLQEALAMRNILALIGAAVLVFAVLGWYFGWYKLGAEPAADGHRKIDVNTHKIVEDVKKGEQKVIDLITNETKGTTVAPTPPTPPVDKKVPGQTTGFQYNADGTWSIVPPKVTFKTIE
jgi:hypothetical protein